MSHMVESLAYAGEVPWHGLGAKLATRLSASDMLRCAGLDWTVEARPVYIEGDASPVKGVKALVRAPHGNVLKVVTQEYGIVQNQQLADLAEAMAGEGVQAWEVAGCLDEGRRVFFCGQVGESEIAGDLIRHYLTLASSHDASLGVTAARTPVRVVCANTLGAMLADAEGEPRISIRHTKNAEAKVKLAAQLVREARAYFGTFNTQALTLVGAQLSVVEAAEIAASLFPTYRSEETGEVVTPYLRDKVVELFRGMYRVPNDRHIAGTRWGLYQALTAALDHNRRGSDRARMSRFLSGTDDTLRSKAWRLLTAPFKKA
jgi:phage/plasmid-like protein (TIGR03299 family)